MHEWVSGGVREWESERAGKFHPGLRHTAPPLMPDVRRRPEQDVSVGRFGLPLSHFGGIYSDDRQFWCPLWRKESCGEPNAGRVP